MINEISQSGLSSLIMNDTVAPNRPAERKPAFEPSTDKPRFVPNTQDRSFQPSTKKCGCGPSPDVAILRQLYRSPQGAEGVVAESAGPEAMLMGTLFDERI